MLESFYATHDYLVSHVDSSSYRKLLDEIDWSERLIAITGGRGIGKTDLLLLYARRQKEQHPERARDILYIDFNNFYFTEHSLYQFAEEFVATGGKTLLLDQLFKIPNWQKELRDCYFHFTGLQIVFVASPLMNVDAPASEISHIVRVYNLRGYSLREYINLQPQVTSPLPAYSLDDILANHEQIAKDILTCVRPLNYMQEYLRHGYYPYREVNRDFSETLLKTMNMSLEVDILLNNQIEVAYLARIRQLLYCLLSELPCSLNVSDLATRID
ncbi:MAG: AAA family ATPase, partial [Paludibacteraceae bacterium]|nr:AAA family ATPase [Paludibacteraceae bacterium]